MKRNPLPSKAETLLLQASLLEGRAAVSAFYAWRHGLNLDLLNLGSQRVLPLLCKNLLAHGIDDPMMSRFRGIARHAWFSTQFLISTCSPLFKAFDQAGIPLVLLKGMALVACLPEQLPLRGMTDIDLLILPADADAAIDLLVADGWRPHYGSPGFVKHEVVGKDKSYLFYRDFHLSLDLHWFALENNRWPEADKALWSHLVLVQIGGTQCHAPGFEDQVLHACVHGAPWNGVATLRWAADAIIILRAKQGIFDWSYSLDQCGQRRVTIQIRNCLEYLRRFFDVPVPNFVLKELRKQRVSMIETLDYWLRAQNPADLALSSRSFLALQDYRASKKALSEGSAFTAICALLRERWAVDSVLVALEMAVFTLMGRPRLFQFLVRGARGDVIRTATLERRVPAKISDGPIDLSLSGDPKNTLLYGWCLPEAGGRWTDGPEAVVAVDVGDDRGDLRVTVTLLPMLAVPKSRVGVSG